MSAPTSALPYRQNIALLAAAQALLLTNGVTLVAINGLLGLQLAADQRLATLPITTYVIGAALAAVPAALFMKHHGRRVGFMLGAAFGAAGALLSAIAVYAGSFSLLCLGTILAGIYNAFGQQYRFAAVDAAPVDWRGKAISLTLAGGIVGGVIGPQVGTLTRNLLQPTYLASYLALIGFAALAMLLASRLEIPALPASGQQGAGRPFREIARQPELIVAVLAAACGYATMNLLMTATPLAMEICGLPFADTAFILQWHVIGMFAPSFFTGDLIKRYGVLTVLLVGAALLLVCIGIALSGVSLMHFWWALVLLGVGWNFLFVGGTTLLTEACRPEEKAKIQGSNDFVVLGVQGATSFAAGLLVTDGGWTTLSILALPLVALTTLASVVLAVRRRRRADDAGF
ncbi:MAG TPA: MFS transporter [Accumulibacter sp.]|uniref:MFS transporter n=1 Tax=Accumulibacter sp. TaxID=2053492 RepID=UPI000ECF5B10|nr:MFS transporter [Accumulibacter sp.]HCZ15071.1 MFS transporter [Accumulibacter sp.]HRF73234.1 MFS transporter [Accumulibacter sp.]